MGAWHSRRPHQRHCGTGIWRNRDIAAGWRDLETPCASLPTRSPSHPAPPRGKPRFSTLESRSGRETDSPLEGTGFEPSVPRQEKWSMPSSSDQTRVGRTLTLRGGAESSLEGREIELSVSPKDIRTSPYDLCANRSDRRKSREGDRWFESTSLQRRVSGELRSEL
jgi:hypothetical protein